MASIDNPSVTKVTTRSDLSFFYRVIRSFLRPLRPRLVQLGKPLPAGSPKLTKRPKSIGRVRIEERRHEILPETPSEAQDNGLWLYDFVPSTLNVSESLRNAKHLIYYFAGGGFQMPPSSEHWKFCARLAQDFHEQVSDKGVRICIVSYPLAPNCPAVQSLPILHGFLRRSLKDAAEKGSQVTLMGDSAGGNIVISLSMWWAQQLKDASQAADNTNAKTEDSVWIQKAGRQKTLRNIFVMSPPCDLRNQNPDIKEADKHDPVLSISLTDTVAQAWAKGTSTSDVSLSPNLADFSALKESSIKVHGVVGTHDILAPDALVFKDLCSKAGIEGDWLIWEGQMHCFPLTQCYRLKEGKTGTEWVERVMRENS